MRVLVVHNRYSSATPSGENAVVDNEVRWLQDAGIEVERFEVDNDDVTGRSERLVAGVSAVWNLGASRSLARRLASARPDVVHVHNVFPLLSASVVAEARRVAPVVWTVHNYRLGCVAGTYHRDGAPCDACASTRRTAGVRHACFAGSRSASAAVTLATAGFERVARSGVVAAPVSAHVGRWLVARGFAPERVIVKHNGVDDPGPASGGSPSRSDQIVFVGRLAPEKGVRELLAAWRGQDGPSGSLAIVGDGELMPEVQAAASADPRVTVTGLIPRALVLERMRSARAVVLPSQWDEPFPVTAVEALAVGRPILTSGLGGLAELVDDRNGWNVGPTVDGLRSGLQAVVAADAHELDRRGAAARERYERSHTPEATTAALTAIYDAAIALREH